MKDDLAPATLAVHAGRIDVLGAVVDPVFHSAIYEDPPGGDCHDLRYIRLNNTPNAQSVATAVAALEGAEAGLVLGSGMAAIATALMSVLRSGDHLLASRGLYGGTHGLLTVDFARLGIDVTFVDPCAVSNWDSALRPNTVAVLVESISNPLVRVGDHPAIVAFARAHGLVTLIDNTLASPLNYRPLLHGYDLCIHSATKYLNGHSDLVAGVVLGSAERIGAVKRVGEHMGGSLDPSACARLRRGLMTIELRVTRQNVTALRLARHLEGKPGVLAVYHPGLASHADHARSVKLLNGAGGLFSVEIEGGGERALAFLNGLQLFRRAPSFGGVESLATRPVDTSHRGVPDDVRRASGIGPGLVRLAVGVEDSADLARDLDGALSA
jgi:cystathionine gamma-synthase/cystathionine gamma-lyase/cystathionine beta-lyase